MEFFRPRSPVAWHGINGTRAFQSFPLVRLANRIQHVHSLILTGICWCIGSPPPGVEHADTESVRFGSAAHGSVSVHRYLAAARAGLWLRARMGLTDTYGRIPVSGCNPPTLAMKRVIFMAGGGGVCADRRAFAVSE